MQKIKWHFKSLNLKRLELKLHAFFELAFFSCCDKKKLIKKKNLLDT